MPMPLVVVILPKIKKSQQLFNEHELLGLAIRSRSKELKTHRAVSPLPKIWAPPKCLKCIVEVQKHPSIISVFSFALSKPDSAVQ
ncbi:unnamed protein product [Acanthoscelides obtectus]|uniref:Uncharacterized protein n=1 Tax=Acanthoscelides obtectus TaxID=200917 RepID=A0A9P0L1Y0_ACAOB|nr:unnamed protein product [Acanthoscelides obtectus]CAK1663139.1 hypothetical protein AOBTE_LOCUS23501 [Acanthoscelides obtectus]